MNLSDFGLEGGSRKTLFVLGAGASRGASFIKDNTVLLPPLDADFFRQLSRLHPSKESKNLLRFVRDEFGLESGLSMEGFLSEADYTDRFHRDLKLDPGPFVKKYQKALGNFYKVLPKMLLESTNKDCEYHEIIASMLMTKDCVITFNYDCLMDNALKKAAGQRWDPEKEGYGFRPTKGSRSWVRHDSGRSVRSSIRLLKLHGSLNWKIARDGGVSLVKDVRQVKTVENSIIPPTWFKNLQRNPFDSIWKQARREVRVSRVMVVVGYSVPQTDLFSRSLFKVEAGSKERTEKLDLLVIVNPDTRSRRKFIELVRNGISSSTVVLEYDWLSELAAVIKRHDKTNSNEES